MRHTLTAAQATLAKRRRQPSETRLMADQQLRQLLPRLRRFALSLSRQPACADDLVQATLERALSRWGSKRADSDLRAWLFSILYRQFLDTQRRAKRHARLLALFGREDASAPSPEQHWEAHATLQAFNQLPDEQRALLLLVSVEGLSYQQTADTLGIPIGTVMSRLSRARQALRDLSGDTRPRPAMRRLK